MAWVRRSVWRRVGVVRAYLETLRGRVGRALRFPLRGPGAVSVLFVGGVLWWMNFFFLPSFLVLGFMTRVLGTVVDEADDASVPEPPDFDRWGTLLTDGVRAFLIWFSYLVVPWSVVIGSEQLGSEFTTTSFLGFLVPQPPSVVLLGLSQLGLPTDRALAVLSDVLNQPVPTPPPASPLYQYLTIVANPLRVSLFEVGAFSTVELYVLLSLVLYVTPVALANFATGPKTLAAGFDFEVLRGVLLDWRYALSWVVVFALLLAGSLPFAWFGLPGSIVYVYAWMAAYYVVGETWAELEPATLDKRVARLEREVRRLRERLRRRE